MVPANASSTRAAVWPSDLTQDVATACGRIAPTWPLDRFIAVNPFWGSLHEPVPAVSQRLTSLVGSRLLMPRAYYRAQWQAGAFSRAHLATALAEIRSPLSLAQVLARLEQDTPSLPRHLRVMDVIDARRDLVHGMSFRDFVTVSTSQFCAAFFDDSQRPVGPDRTGGLYATWRRHALQDRSPGLLMGLGAFRALAEALPSDAQALILTALAELDVPLERRADYLTALLLDLNGWAAWCAYLRWQAQLAGTTDDHLTELVALRLAWELVLLRNGGKPLAAEWRVAVSGWPAIDAAVAAAETDEWVYQRALELAYQERLKAELETARPASEPADLPAVQAAFCIDVRSEVLRRALEAEAPRVQTLGFAGFFGLPVEYEPLGAARARPQLPGLLAPRLRVTDTGLPAAAADTRRAQLGFKGAWKRWKGGAASSFSFVETLGAVYAAKLLGDGLGWSRPVPAPDTVGLTLEDRALCKPRLTHTVAGAPVTPEEKAELAAGVLRAMSLTKGHARLIALVGHGSKTVNNPHAAGLDCGACCGQTGEVNARALAALLNEPEVRQGLAARGLPLPATTHFVAGLHNTTTDEITLFELEACPPSHAEELRTLRAELGRAAVRARAERAGSLGLDELSGHDLDQAVAARTRDWAEVRPEWGLSNNAAFIVAPRAHLRHVNLAGRAFLHDYRWQGDEGFAILELIMTAPMVVTHWINFQYYASTVDNQRFGSGNKVLHNVVGGHIGVFEGNAGDLRIGLPMQSLHDGTRWVHTPVRLSVYIDAPEPALQAVLRKHAHIRNMVANGWIYLFQFDSAERQVKRVMPSTDP
ncbi:MAG: DUF2309 domain-containing protein [Myxococcales bacterium]|nr:DUF2309 domain-containing protein [Myxococcales bacterium]